MAKRINQEVMETLLFMLLKSADDPTELYEFLGIFYYKSFVQISPMFILWEVYAIL